MNLESFLFMTSLPITFSDQYISLVQVGDTVTVGQPIVQRLQEQHVVINIAAQLNIPVQKAIKFLKKNPGDMVSPDDAIAVKKGMLGFNEEVVESKVMGTVIRFERDTSNLVIRLQKGADTDQENTPENILSPVDGTVAMCDNGKILIQTDKDIIVGRKGIGSEVSGELHVLVSGDSDQVQPYHIDTTHINNIILGKKFTREVLLKGVGVGVAGIIGTTIAEADMTYLVTKNLAVPIIQIDDDAYEQLAKWDKKHVFFNGESKTIILLKL